MRLALAMALTAGAAIAIACGSFGTAEGEGGVTPPADAAAIVDAASTATDASDPADGGLDGSQPCETWFTESFGGTASPSGWFVNQTAGGTLTFGGPGTPASPSGTAFIATAAVTDSGAGVQAFLSRTRSGLPRSIDVAYLLDVNRVETYVEFGCILFFVANQNPFVATRVQLTTAPNQTIDMITSKFLGNDATVDSTPIALGTQAGGWRQVKLSVDLSDVSNAVATASINGANAPTPPFALVPNVSTVYLQCGIVFANAAPGTTIIGIDDVKATVCPR